MIVDGRHSLVLAESKHLPFIVKWKNDHGRQWKPTSVSDQEALIGRTWVDPAYLAVSLRDGRPIGVVQVVSASKSARTKAFSIFSEPEDETDTARLVCAAEFEMVGSNKIQTIFPATDAKRIKVYEFCGFQQELRRRQHEFVDGKFVAAVQMAILAESYERHKNQSATS